MWAQYLASLQQVFYPSGVEDSKQLSNEMVLMVISKYYRSSELIEALKREDFSKSCTIANEGKRGIVREQTLLAQLLLISVGCVCAVQHVHECWGCTVGGIE